MKLYKLPGMVHHMLSKYHNLLRADPAVIYARGLLDAFHPSVKGVGIPKPIPSNTLKHSTYYSSSFTTPVNYYGPTVLIFDHLAKATSPVHIFKSTQDWNANTLL